jgi:hypothetical protein
MLKNIRQSILTKMFCLLSIASMLYTSCSKEANGVAAAPVEYMATTKIDFTALETAQKAIMTATYKRGDVNQATTLEQRHDIIKEEIQKYSGSTASCVEFAKIQDAFEKYGKDKTFEESLAALVSDKVLSETQGQLFANLNAKMNADNLSREIFFANLESFEKDVIDNAKMSIQEKDVLMVFARTTKTQAQIHEDLTANGPESPCTDCLWKNKWRIFGWSQLWAIAATAGCMLASLGTATPLCIIIIVGTGTLDTIRAYCGSVCSWI